ncbi:MAG: hypothetical protein LC792_16450 [Actinobacteria bacterium]|nr:hypothetical protein [Actinomycetota bacterium]
MSRAARRRRRPGAGLVAAGLALSLASAAACSSPARSGGDVAVASMARDREGGGAGNGNLAVRLADGKVLVAGGVFAHGALGFDPDFYLAESEVLDPATGRWTRAGDMQQARFGHALVLLPSGQVLAAGGYGGGTNYRRSAELFDPRTRAWTSVANMATCHSGAPPSRLPGGAVMMAGGVDCDGKPGATAEIFDPAQGRWSRAAPLHTPRWGHATVSLADGRVLVLGGRQSAPGADSDVYTDGAEIYDPRTGAWTPTRPMTVPRVFHAAGVLASGKVIAAGGRCTGGAGCDRANHSSSAELYDPATDTWTATAPMLEARVFAGYLVLPGGRFLMAGGSDTPTTEVYDPERGAWARSTPMKETRSDVQPVLLRPGRVLLAGGYATPGTSYRTTATAEILRVG